MTGTSTDDAGTLGCTQSKAARRPRPHWLEQLKAEQPQLHSVVEQTYDASDVSANILAVSGIRVALEWSALLLGVRPNLNFSQKVQRLHMEGWIHQTEENHLRRLSDFESALTRGTWCPNIADTEMIFTAFERFLERSLITGKLGSVTSGSNGR